MARFYSNENIPKQVADELTNRFRHDVLTSLAARNANRSIPDQDVLAFAVETARILLTYNRLLTASASSNVRIHGDPPVAGEAPPPRFLLDFLRKTRLR